MIGTEKVATRQRSLAVHRKSQVFISLFRPRLAYIDVGMLDHLNCRMSKRSASLSFSATPAAQLSPPAPRLLL